MVCEGDLFVECLEKGIYLLSAIVTIIFSFVAWREGKLAGKAAEDAEKKMEARVVAAEKKLADAEAYAGIDINLKDILKISIDNPNFRNPEAISQMIAKEPSSQEIIDESKRYGKYAEICMNMVETIYDKVLLSRENRITYGPTALWEIILHGKWFKENKNKFQEDYTKFVIEIMKELGKIQMMSRFVKFVNM